MRRPYPAFLAVSILLTVLYFKLEKTPEALRPKDELSDKVMFGIVLVVLMFSAFSLIYLASKKRR